MSEKSALRLIPGRDALLEYTPQIYKAKTYVEYQGLVYKSLVDTSASFITTEWELIGDLRDIRVPNIASRNALTGSTPTTGTTGIHIPIIDNSNVLVLNASGDPQVGGNKFARYNYNKATNSFLLLQISTGSTSSNVSNYTLLTNKPSIISGITATAGVGLSGGGIFSGTVPPNRITFSYQHADTSSQANVLPTGRTYTQQLRFDTFGHVTGATTSAWTHPDTSSQPTVNNSGFTYIQSVQVDGDGHITSLGSSTWVHPDTSSQGSVNNTGNTVIQSIQLDSVGHVIGLTSGTVSGGGGGGVNFSVAGNSGGVISMPNAGILRITGGTNIQTVSNLIGSNLGLRINMLPAGSNGQIQLNNSGALGVGGGFTFLSSVLSTPLLTLSSLPASGSTTQILTRNTSTGQVERVGFTTLKSSLAGLPVNAIQYRDDTGFAGDAQFKFYPTQKAITLGSRTSFGGAVTGQTSVTIGTSNRVDLANSMAVGTSNRITGTTFSNGPHIAIGDSNLVYSLITAPNTNFAIGRLITVGGFNSGGLGADSIITGNNSYGIGTGVEVTGAGSIAIGGGNSTGNKRLLAAGSGTINISHNDQTFQTAGHGALALTSSIFGGQNHNIATGNTRAVIVGGDQIKLSGGSTYIDTVVVPELALWTTPPTIPAGGVDNLLTWNSINKKVRRIILPTTAGSVLFKTTVGIGGNALFSYQTTQNALTIGSRIAGVSSGSTTLVVGSNGVASGTSSVAFGNSTIAGSLNSFAVGSSTKATGVASFAGGQGTGGLNKEVRSSGTASFNFSGNNSGQVAGEGALADQSAILGGQNHNIASGNVRSAIIGGSLIKLTGTTYIEHVAVPNLAIFTTPIAGGSDDVLTWNSTSKKVGKVTQLSLTPVYNLVAYVSKNGNDSTGVVGVANKPYLTIQAAINAVALLLTVNNRGLVHVMQGQYTGNVNLFSTVDINMNNAELTGDFTDNSVLVISRIFGSGKFRSLIINAASTISVECDEISNASNDAILISTTSVVPEVKITAKKITGNIQANNGLVFITTKLWFSGFLNPFGTSSTSLDLFLDVDYANNTSSSGVISFGSSLTSNARVYANIRKIRCLSTSNPAVDISSNFIGVAVLNFDEVFSNSTTAPLSISQTNANTRITIKGRFVCTNGGNIPAAIINSSGGAFTKIVGGSQFVPSGSAFSIAGTAQVVALGQIFGKNANDVNIVVNLGTFTANSTYITAT